MEGIVTSTIFPLRLTFAQKEVLVRYAKADGVDVDRPGSLNTWIIAKLGLDQ